MSRVAGKLTLVQVSTMSGQVNIFDVQTTPALMVMGGLKKLLESNIVKVSDLRAISHIWFGKWRVT
jgi:hypothetical protein